MYMYYFLSHKLLGEEVTPEKMTIANNTFILALDGDVDFQPSALRLLIDLMKGNTHVGAACGRILPIGLGLFNAYFTIDLKMPCLYLLTRNVYILMLTTIKHWILLQ